MKRCKKCKAKLSDYEIKTFGGVCKWCFAKEADDEVVNCPAQRLDPPEAVQVLEADTTETVGTAESESVTEQEATTELDNSEIEE